jgi:RHS repeat-associated protein
MHEGVPAPADAKCCRTWLGDGGRDIREDTRFEYAREHWHTKVTDADGNVTIHRYDYHNRIVLVEHPDGSSESFEWDDNHNLTGIRSAPGHMQRFEYDAQGRVTATTDALGNTTRTEYDAHGLPVKVSAANGDVTRTAYDESGRPVSVTDASGRTTAYRWSRNGRLLSLTDPKGGSHGFRYDNGGRLIEATDCSGYSTQYVYDERGYLSRRIDAEGQPTLYRCDARGQVVKVTHPDGTGEQFTWDGEGNLKRHCDGAGQVTEYSHNARGQLVYRKDAAGRSLSYRYDRLWRLAGLHNESGEETAFRYDALGQLVGQTGFDGSTVEYTWDEAGQLTGKREGDIETRYVRDPLGRLTERRTQGPANSGVAGVSEHFHYDARGRLVTARTNGSRVRLHYDDAGNLVAEERDVASDDGLDYVTVTRHTYDALGNRTATVLPNTRQIDWLRYGSGHVHGVLLDGAPLLDFERDRLHRETRRSHAAFTQTREYDPMGRLARFVARPAAAGPHERLAERRLSYAATGNLTRIDDHSRGATDYTYDPVGRLLKSVTTDLTEVFAFDAAGNPVDPERVPPRPVVETPEELAARRAREQAEDAAWLRAHPGEKSPPLHYNERGIADRRRLDEWKASLPRCVGDVLRELNRTRYGHDARGNLARRVEPDGTTWLYRYDAANRLIEAQRFAKPPQADELERRVPADGGGWRFVEASVRPALKVSFAYDAFGRRTQKKVTRAGGEVERTFFTWDGDVLLMEERFHRPVKREHVYRGPEYRCATVVREDPDDVNSLPVAQRMHTLDTHYEWRAASLYLHEPGTFVPLARLDEKLVEAAFLATGTDGGFVQVPAKTRHATYFYQNDHLGTPQELVDDSGKVVWLARYRAWGGAKRTPYGQSDPGEADNRIRFQGQYHDEETGLCYNRHRYYDPNTGRYISKDPIGLAGGINVYAYVKNPIVWIDPFGLQARGPVLLGMGDLYRTDIQPPISALSRSAALASVYGETSNLAFPSKEIPGEWVGVNVPWSMPIIKRYCAKGYFGDSPFEKVDNSGKQCRRQQDFDTPSLVPDGWSDRRKFTCTEWIPYESAN